MPGLPVQCSAVQRRRWPGAFIRSAMGALPQLYAAVALDVQGDDYYGPEGLGELRGHPEKVGRTSKAKSVEDAGRLWDVSGELTGITYNALG